MSESFTKTYSTLQDKALECEVKGLEILRSYTHIHGLKIPKILNTHELTLELEFITAKSPTPADWYKLGIGLARMHKISAQTFGLDHDNFIGRSVQINTPMENWGEFFIQQRLAVQVELIKDEQKRNYLQELFQKYRLVLLQTLNEHHPRPGLLHGDLWSGNVLFDSEGPVLIDPAVYFGDREADLAMTMLFKGFSEDFYRAYRDTYPLHRNFKLRVPLYNLYHYLNHYNLFGESYWRGVAEGAEALRRYGLLNS